MITPATPQGASTGSSTKSWRFDCVAIMTALEGPQPVDCTTFQLSFDHPGKTRRRTPENWQDFVTRIVTLKDNLWTSEPAKGATMVGGRRKPGDVPPSRAVFYDALIVALAKSTCRTRQGHDRGLGGRVRPSWPDRACAGPGGLQAASLPIRPLPHGKGGAAGSPLDRHPGRYCD